jgi:Raf kinase inhibitor-like YbhB/YbcL family protein
MFRSVATVTVLATAAGVALCAQGEPKMTIAVSSSAFAEGQPIPKKYTGDGADVSPPLSWSDLPPGTRELALVCDDPDAPRAEPWVHWVIYKIPADQTGLPEHVAPDARLDVPSGALQGSNSWTSGRTIGYRGPAPPPGKVHHYRFHVYALDAPLDAEPALDKAALLRAIRGHVLGEGRLIGTYHR